MADEVPVALKAADVALYKTASRAAQLQFVKPIVAYWAEYWVVNQILAKQLHTTDPQILEYTTRLMDKLEQTKNDYAHEDAVVDDTAGQAYIEQFAQETLDRAQRVVKANKVTAQTANTFDAAAGFLSLVQIWGPLDNEAQQKIKYAKWNAARIFKAIKQGEDPNESNPKPEELAAQEPALDPMDPEVQMLSQPQAGANTEARAGTLPNPVSLEDAPDADLRNDVSPLPRSPSSIAPSHQAPQDELVLPSAPPSAPGYFDDHQDPSPISPSTHRPASHEPPAAPGDIWTPTPPPASAASAWPPPSSSIHVQPPPATGPPTFASSPQSTPAVGPLPMSPNPDPKFMNFTPTATSAPRPAHAPAPVPASTYSASAAVAANYTVDDQAMSQAQKHARWAISALNFEDVPTAVRELRRALEKLGAS